MVSMGHRNPQGLSYVKDLNLIINSEHGPKGGDEINFNYLNKTSKIKNFGWPIASYGEPYFGPNLFKSLIPNMVLSNQQFILHHLSE